ncbi:MAG TPA: hypothetical protein VK448_02945 [Dissulfurispiraceae bacterium]|nr:hypothetical protein [Dissulfurispiraceae bacterium]
MKISSVPIELLNICKRIVEQHHGEHGIGNLSSDIETPDNVNILTLIPEASAVLKNAAQYYSVRKWCFMASIGFVILTVVIPWWSLAALVLIFLADRILASREKNGWKLLSAVLLSLEFLANDFLGWGTAYPREKEEAKGALMTDAGSPRSGWLDYYLPRRGGMDPSQLKDFQPSMPPK